MPRLHHLVLARVHHFILVLICYTSMLPLIPIDTELVRTKGPRFFIIGGLLVKYNIELHELIVKLTNSPLAV